MPHIDPYMGVRVHTTTMAPEWTDGPLYQWRFPRSKKRRIRKKWARRRANLRHKRVRYAVQMGDVLVMHPFTYDALTGGPAPLTLPR